MSDKNNSKVNFTSITGVKGFTFEDAVKSNDIVKSKDFVKKSYSFNDNVAGNGFNSTGRNDNFINEIITPEYDPEALNSFYDFSDSVGSCIDAYKINISGFGYELVEERETISKDGKKFYKDTGEEVPLEVIKEMRDQFSKATMFFDSVSLDMAWDLMLKLETEAKEKSGSGYFEVERDFYNNIQGLKFVESASMRMTKRNFPLIVKQVVKNPITLQYEEQARSKNFRKFVQLQCGTARQIWFKEFNDPRIMNALTGEFLQFPNGEYVTNKTVSEEFAQAYKNVTGQEFRLATEIIFDPIYNTSDLDGYGLPRFISLIPVLLGVKFSDLDDYSTLENKGIPKYAMIIEGANAEDVSTLVQNEIKNNKEAGEIKSFLVISADSTNTGTNSDPNYKNPNIRLEPLNQLLIKDGLKGKTEYVEKISERVAGRYRLPTAYFGKLDNVNRSSLEVIKDITNEQVFIPESMDRDNWINKLIMTELRCSHYRYRSKTSRIENPELKLTALKDSVNNGSQTPAEAREDYAKILGKQLPDIESDFMNTPYPMSIRSNGTKPSTLSSLTAPEGFKKIELEENKDSEVYSNLKKFVSENFNINPNQMVILAK